MTAWIALLRAVNVGGTGKLPMADLKRMADDLGFGSARTYIASGNLLFTSESDESTIKARLEQALAEYAGRHVGVTCRSSAEMSGVADANPFTDDPPNRVVAIFLNAPPPLDALEQVRGVTDERLALGRREIYVSYGSGMADSKVRIPAAAQGTARNMNSVARLAALASEIQ